MSVVDTAVEERNAPIGDTGSFGVIYFVEDSRTQAKFMSAQLNHFGYDVEHFDNPKDCIEALTQYTPKVVLTDIEIGTEAMAGLDAVPIYKTSGADAPKVIVLSSRTDFPTRLKAVQVGVDDYFVKPANVPQLVDRIDQLMDIQPDVPLRVLVVDDQRTAVSYYSSALRRFGMQTVGTTKPQEVLDLMAEHRPDVVVCDLNMPMCNGFELAQVIRQVEAFRGTPVIFLTATDYDLVMQLDAIKHGGDEFLSKNMDHEFVASVVRARGLRARAIERYMFRDSMTGLYKHSALKENLARELQRAERDAIPLCFAMTDIDHFKSVNDTYGHAVGDRVIISLARILSQNLRPSDIVGRYGGEEFAVVLPDSTPQEALNAMDRLREKFAGVRHSYDGGTFTSSFSCGIASSTDFSDIGALIENADKALYAAKHGGRNQVRVAPPETG